MPADRPPIFDDGGGLPDVDRSQRRRRRPNTPRRDDGGRDDQHAGDTFGDLRGPNFLVRRALAVGAVVVVVALGAVGVGRFLNGSGDGADSSSSNPDWNTIVSVDGTSGTVVVSGNDGVETDRFRLGVQPLTDSAVIGPTVVATSATALAVVSLRDTETITTIDIESTGTLLMPSGSAQTLIGHDAPSQRAVFVHGPTGEVIDTDSIAAVVGARYDLELARSDPSGRNVLVTDTGNFQSVLFSFDREEPSYFPGLALAVDSSLVVTAQNVGNNATVTVFDHAGEPSVSARTESVRAGMIVDSGVVLVGVDGEIVTLATGDGEISSTAKLAIGTVRSGHVATRGDRLIVIGDLGTAIIGTDGLVVAELPGSAPTTTGIDQGAPRRSTCLIVERDIEGEVAVVDLDDGTIIAEALASAEVVAGVNGCEPVVPTSAGYLVLTGDGILRATIPGEVVGLSPDGRTVVTENANRLELLPRTANDDESTDTEPIDIGRSGRTVFFAEL